MSTIATLLEWGKAQLFKQEMALLEAQILLSHALHCERSYLYTWPDKEVSPHDVAIFESLILRRQQNEPIAYIIGQREFWSLTFDVDQNTLIPRHETEVIVETVLALLPLEPLKVLDLGTGCGTIACALAHARNQWQLVGIDISLDALKIATKNAKALQLANVTFLYSDWLQALKGMQFDAVVGNPPYIRSGDVHLIHGDLPFEPTLALTPGPTGLEAFQAILLQVKEVLKPGGLLAFEHGFDQASALRNLFEQAGFKDIKTYVDHAGNERVTVGRLGYKPEPP